MGDPPCPGSPRRIVVLGASNVARGISVILGTAGRIWNQPLEVFAAYGHGRSYGLPSRVLRRELSGIAQCGLWEAIRAREPVPTTALVTDIGNDLIYGRSVDQIAGWVDACLARCNELGAQSIVTKLPIDNLEGLPQWKFRLARKIFFPGCNLTLETVAERARALDERVAELAARRGARLVSQRRDWYAVDPIHITYREMARAWHEVLSHWADAPNAGPPAQRRAGSRTLLRSVFPERRRVFGFEQRTAQPAGRLGDGSTLWFY